MTNGLLANSNPFASSLPWGLLSMYHSKVPENYKQFSNRSSAMNNLISGSTSDADGMKYIRPSAPRIQESYDPFAMQYRRCSPPRSHKHSTTVDAFSPNQMVPLQSNIAVRPSLHQESTIFQGLDDVQYASGDGQHRTTIIEDHRSRRRRSQDSYGPRTSSPFSQDYVEYEVEERRCEVQNHQNTGRYHTRRRPFNQDEFDGPSQYLPLPLPQQDMARTQDLTSLPVTLTISEQDEVIHRANNILSECAYHFVAKYQFPVPIERDKPRVQVATDREWTEWAYLLKRLATKRRIPARVLYDNQIKQFVTILENSVAARQSVNKGQSTKQKQKPKDDWFILQLVSAGVQVSKILVDSLAMQQLCDLYNQTEAIILDRRRRLQHPSTSG